MGIKAVLLSATVGLAGFACSAPAGVLGVAQDYNAFIFQNMNQTSDSQGALAVGGNLTLNSYSVASALGDSTTNLVVGGNFTLNGGSVNGSSIIGGDATINNVSPAGDVTVGENYSGNNGPTGTVYYKGNYSGPTWINSSKVSSVTVPIDFASAEITLTDTSTQLSQLTTTGSLLDYYGTLTFTGTSSGLNVFSIPASTLDSSYGVNISIPAGAFAVVNVTGSSSVSLPNVGFNFNSADVLWNLSGVTTLSMSSFDGSILAPSAAVTFGSGDLNGTLVANSLSGGGELHNVLFDHSISPPNISPSVSVPLPGSAEGGLALLSCIGVVELRRRRHKGLI